MKCPACGGTLSELKVGDLTVDVCRGGCGGIWFDEFELGHVDDQDEAAGESLLDIETDPLVKVDTKSHRRCPQCPEIVMQRHFYGPKRRVEIDECGKCGGIWLDAGELAAIRAEYKNQAEREQAVHDYAVDVLRDALARPALSARAGERKHLPVGSILRLLWRKR
jgi:hypothetical protein